ncbi:MAG: M48 family metalloprotease [Burkholderiales bacterium]
MRRSRTLIFLLALLGAGAARGETLPELGDSSQSVISPLQERQLGASIMRQLQASPAFIDDPQITDYLEDLGYRLVSVSPDARQRFRFFALQDNSVNAFALPGGYIGVHSGLLLTAQTESEVAAVLSHEVAHVTQRHIARLIASQQRQGLASLAAVAVAILAARSNPQAAAGAIAATQAQALSDTLGFTRDNEREADRVGVQILERAGFDVHAMPAFLERLQRATRVIESGAPSYLRTHPITYERIADVQNRTFDVPFKQVPDSLEFHLVRGKLRALQKDAREGVAYFDDLIAERKFSNEVGARFGLVHALLRGKSWTRASSELVRLEAIAPPHPMIASLRAKVLMAAGRRADALATYVKAQNDFPNDRGLIYEHAQALIDARQGDAANTVIDARLQKDPDDGRLYELQARAYASLGKPMMKHRSLAEAYVAQGDLGLAIEQLQLALRNSDGDFYNVSSVEARLKELRSISARR